MPATLCVATALGACLPKDSKVKIFVIPTDEEFMIASDVERIVNGK